MLIKGPGTEDSHEQRLLFEQTIHKYMELARQQPIPSSPYGGGVGGLTPLT